MARELDFADVVLAPEHQLNVDEFVLLWVDDWYDGPLGAMIARGGERAYLAIHDRSVLETDEPWRWVILRLSPAALDERNRQHALFAHHVGEHWCCHAAPHPSIDGERVAATFYEQQATRPHLTRADCRILGWLSDAPRSEVVRGSA